MNLGIVAGSGSPVVGTTSGTDLRIGKLKFRKQFITRPFLRMAAGQFGNPTVDEGQPFPRRSFLQVSQKDGDLLVFPVQSKFEPLDAARALLSSGNILAFPIV